MALDETCRVAVDIVCLGDEILAFGLLTLMLDEGYKLVVNIVSLDDEKLTLDLFVPYFIVDEAIKSAVDKVDITPELLTDETSKLDLIEEFIANDTFVPGALELCSVNNLVEVFNFENLIVILLSLTVLLVEFGFNEIIEVDKE